MRTIHTIIIDALHEDMPRGDISSRSLFQDETFEGRFLAKAPGILSGIDIAKQTFLTVDSLVNFQALKKDGDPVFPGDTLAVVSGKAASLLMGERVALNFLQRMSGIATLTNRFVQAVKGTKAKILDTRKTTPGLRILEKQAVRDGGGTNHRMSLSDMVMLKDNHLRAAGSISRAVARVKESLPAEILIEVEVENYEMFLEALNTPCDIIMLDNMSLSQMRRCVTENQHRKILEASGNMTLRRIHSVAMTKVDHISVGALTHSYQSLDISLKF